MKLAALALAGLLAFPASAAVPQVTTHSWTDISGCRYKAHIDSVGHETVKAYIDIDSCGRKDKTWMHAWAVCAAGPTEHGANENVGGTWSKTGSCPDGNLYIHKWGVQSYQYVRASGGGCKCRREWVTHVFGSNNA